MLSGLAKNSSSQSDWSFSFPVFEQVRCKAPVIGFSYVDGFRMIAGGRAEYARAEAVSGNYHALGEETACYGFDSQGLRIFRVYPRSEATTPASRLLDSHNASWT